MSLNASILARPFTRTTSMAKVSFDQIIFFFLFFFSVDNFRDILPKMIHTNWFGKGQKISKANYDILDSPKKEMKLTILIKEDPQDSEFRLFFGRIEDAINCFRDLLTFSRDV